ncbi:Hpt domain-containing protein [Mesobacterium sp. TK19101]|uniref:Hpt domain-containing protein n=1 Tax=Mesobacterium hydrothermale TaxID=3111907 RepID=A0ABU6HE00_9RHOB|nr:Hpt domain-containing protein [Mesobacterium sp. TK19101]MEC3860688.1 Hpt domain-containing protein [Mesobacterium sp. TK19101]
MIAWDRVSILRHEIGPDGFGEVVELFLAEVEEALDGLHPGLDAPAFEAGLHFLKGSALNLGFSALAELCQAGESAAAQGQTDVNLDQVRAVYAASRDQFLAGLRARLDG